MPLRTWRDSAWRFITDAFRAGDGRISPVLVALFIAIHSVLLFNAIRQAPHVGWDAGGHNRYVRELMSGRLPTEEVTHEFFCPPLPYAPPAAVGLGLRLVGLDRDTALIAAVKTGQVMNVGWSMMLCLFVLHLGRLVSPGRVVVRAVTLGLIGMLPVYYMVFAWVRGEPVLAAFTAAAAYLATSMVIQRRITLARGACLGLMMAAMALSRQWAIPTFLGFGVFAAAAIAWMPDRRAALLRAGAIALLILVPLGASHYAGLKLRYGSFSAFNQESRELDVSNQTLAFYTDWKIQPLFDSPYRPHLGNHLWPLLYTGLWGDYWGFWVVWGEDERRRRWVDGSIAYKTEVSEGRRPDWLSTNRDAIVPYLARVNRVSLVPTLLAGLAILAMLPAALAYLFRGRLEPTNVVAALCLLAAAFSFIGFMVFLITVPTEKGNTIKTGYQLHILPLLALVTALWLDAIHRRFPRVFWVAILALGLVAIHNLPLFFTRYTWMGP